MRSVVVVFPASMWAMMPIFRYRSSGVSRAITSIVSVQRKSGATDPDDPVVSLRAHPGPLPLGMGDLLEDPTRCPWRAGGGERSSARSHGPISEWQCGGAAVGAATAAPLPLCPSAPLSSPPIVREGPIRLRHPVGVFLLLDG